MRISDIGKKKFSGKLKKLPSGEKLPSSEKFSHL